MVLLPEPSTRRVFITGCSSGLGRSTALLLARAGMNVVATTRRTQDADALRQLAAKTGIPLSLVVLDLLDEQSIRNAVADAAHQLGGIDVLINNAGVELSVPLEHTSDEEFRWQLDTNVVGTFRMTKAVLPLLRASNHAKLIFISSVVGFAARPFLGAYSASKYAIEGLAEALYFELQPFPIAVTLIEPGKFHSALGINQRLARNFTTKSIYHEHWQRFAAAVSQHLSPDDNPDPDMVAQAIRQVIDHPAPPLHVPVGPDAELTVGLRARPPFEPYAHRLTQRLSAHTPQTPHPRDDRRRPCMTTKIINDTVRELAAAGNLAIFTTLLPNGYPQSHVIWIDHDDDYLLVNTEIHRTKFANVQRNPKVAVTLVDTANHHRYVEIRGDVVEIVRGPAARLHIDALSKKYRGHDYDPALIRSERAILRIARRRARYVNGTHWTGLNAPSPND